MLTFDWSGSTCYTATSNSSTPSLLLVSSLYNNLSSIHPNWLFIEMRNHPRSCRFWAILIFLFLSLTTHGPRLTIFVVYSCYFHRFGLDVSSVWVWLEIRWFTICSFKNTREGAVDCLIQKKYFRRYRSTNFKEQSNYLYSYIINPSINNIKMTRFVYLVFFCIWNPNH